MTFGARLPPPHPPVPFAELAQQVARVVDAQTFPDNPPLVFIPTDRAVRRLGFALQPAPGLAAWAAAERLDAIFLHRSWGAEDSGLPDGVGVLASHQGFDARVTIGASPRFASLLEIRDIHPLGDDGAQGMIAGLAGTEADLVVARLTAIFGGAEEVVPGGAPRVRRIAIVKAMTDALVRLAAARGAELYLTGQIRHPARRALAETGMGAIGIGHRRSEEYALRTLAELLANAFPGRLLMRFHADGAVPA